MNETPKWLKRARFLSSIAPCERAVARIEVHPVHALLWLNFDFDSVDLRRPSLTMEGKNKGGGGGTKQKWGGGRGEGRASFSGR